MADVAFPLGMMTVFAGGACFFGISSSRDPAKTHAYGLGLLGSFIAFTGIVLATALSS